MGVYLSLPYFWRHIMKYKFNGGKGAILCDNCNTIIKENVSLNDLTEDPMYCSECSDKSKNKSFIQLFCPLELNDFSSCFYFKEDAKNEGICEHYCNFHCTSEDALKNKMEVSLLNMNNAK
jgi:hypothetical protein